MHIEFPGLEHFQRAEISDVFVREQPDQDEEEDEGDDKNDADEEEEDDDEGYSE